MKRIFIDTNIIIDLLVQREGFLSSAKVLALARQEGIKLFVSVLTMANVAYILRKVLVGEALYIELAKLSNMLNVVDLTTEHFKSAIALRAKDFEDALQYYCALTKRCDIIVTRNKKDFTFSTIDVMSPEELIQQIGA